MSSADFDDVLADEPAPAPILAEAPATGEDWRDDPTWRLIDWDAGSLSEKPSDRPSAAAELAQPPLWASLYENAHTVVATWYRPRASAPSG